VRLYLISLSHNLLLSNPLSRYQSSDLSVSNKHLHIHCIIFEEESASGIPPLIYAEDFSTNGTYLCNYLTREQMTEKRIDRKGGRVLLKKGDRLRIGSELILNFVYASHHYDQASLGLNELQRRESRVCQSVICLEDPYSHM
jgi:hypothetical protein